MPELIQQSTTAQPLTFLMVLSSDHITGATGLSPTVTLSKNGGAFASPAGAVTEIGSGWYKVAGNATDNGTLGPLLLHATAGTADPSDTKFSVVAFNPQDVVHLGLSGLPNAAAGASGGLQINGANAGAVSYTGGMTISSTTGDALALTSTGGNGNGINSSGNGTGAGLLSTGGATGNGIKGVGGATSGAGINGTAPTSGDGIHAVGGGAFHGCNFVAGATGNGLNLSGGATLGAGLNITTTVGDGIDISPTSGHGINIAANGTSKHGIFATGGTAGTSDGMLLVAGFGGVALAAATITGSLSGSVGSVTGAVTLSLAQTLNAARALDAIADTSLTINDAMQCAIGVYAGKWSITGTSWVCKTPSSGTTIRTFTLDSGTAPTTRS
jgi:hypothetical protein